MERKYLLDLINWINDPQRKPLMVWGARQVGKSYLIEELFAKKYFKNKYLKIDLSDDETFVKYVNENSNLDSTLDYIRLHYNFEIDKNHLLFFDEAQECPAIVKMMKHFCEKKREIPVIVSGSLVRIRMHRDNKRNNKQYLFPVGKINQLYVFPMTFDEFLLNYNKNKYDFLKSHFMNKEKIDPKLHQDFMDDFRTYLFIGGMPEAVDAYLQNYEKDTIEAIKKANSKIQDIYDDYLADMGLYQTSTDSIIRSRLIYKNIYKQLNKENKNFKISQIIDGAKNREMVNPYFWLTTANVVHQSFSLKEKITTPLIQNEESLFRMYLSDMGLFSYQSELNFKTFLIDKDNSLSGIYYENYFAIELVARKFKLFYWKGKRDSEMEFIINIGERIIPIDVKHGRDRLNSLQEYRMHNKKDLVIKVSSNQYGYDKEQMLLTLPFYYVPFFLDDLTNNITIDDNLNPNNKN